MKLFENYVLKEGGTFVSPFICKKDGYQVTIKNKSVFVESTVIRQAEEYANGFGIFHHKADSIRQDEFNDFISIKMNHLLNN